MPPPTTAELNALICNPRELMHVEIKGWLDITSNNDHRALLAKAVIALANHGGGFIVLGFKRDGGVYEPAPDRPPQLAQFNDDAINGIVKSYAAPAFHCSLHLVTDPTSRDAFPVVAVPGGHRVPVQAIKGSPDQRTLINGRVYIRRPGPESAEPRTPEESRELLARCLRANRDDLFDAVRDILSGQARGAASPEPPALDQLLAWAEQGSERWRELAPKDANGRPQLPPGHYRFAYAIQGEFPQPSLPELLRHLEGASIRHTGWPEWVVLHAAQLRPYARDGALECFVAAENPEQLLTDPPHADFWRAMPEGRLLLIRGYTEDATENVAAGSAFDVTLPVWRVGECFLHARAMCQRLGVPNASVIVTARYSGLAGRVLVSLDRRRWLFDDRRARQNEINLALTVEAASIEDSLPEIAAEFLLPLYHLFDLFEPGADLFSAELRRMRQHQF
jgi:hypothetical protein